MVLPLVAEEAVGTTVQAQAVVLPITPLAAAVVGSTVLVVETLIGMVPVPGEDGAVEATLDGAATAIIIGIRAGVRRVGGLAGTTITRPHGGGGSATCFTEIEFWCNSITLAAKRTQGEPQAGDRHPTERKRVRSLARLGCTQHSTGNQMGKCVCGDPLHPDLMCGCGCSLSEYDDGDLGLQIPWYTPASGLVHWMAVAAMMNREA